MRVRVQPRVNKRGLSLDYWSFIGVSCIVVTLVGGCMIRSSSGGHVFWCEDEVSESRILGVKVREENGRQVECKWVE